MIAIASFCVKANAQLFLGGTFGVGHRQSAFSLSLKPRVGYEFSDRWAVGLALGVAYQDDDFYGCANPYVRFNCWNNGNLFIDLKASGDLAFNKDRCNALVGLKPSLRYAFNNHWQVSGDIGLLGVEIVDGDVTPAFVLSSTNVELNFMYKF